MKIAIVGAGFCGLAVAWHLLQSPSVKITLIDANGIGLGASGIAAGLLHPFSGAHAKLNWRGREGVEETKKLLSIATNSLRKPIIAQNRGILRLALNAEQLADFQLCAKRYPEETAWLDEDSCQSLASGSPRVPGLWVREGITVYATPYLQGLWHTCEALGAHFEKRKITTLKELSDFDTIVLTPGAESLKIPELSTLPLTCVKGQVLELSWPEGCPPLGCPLNSHVYLLMTEEGKSCLVGSTYEKGFKEALPDLEAAKKEILPKAYELYPPLEKGRILNCYAGMRAVTPTHRPLMQKLSHNTWILTGMGSKGLLYHALYAKELAQAILSD